MTKKESIAKGKARKSMMGQKKTHYVTWITGDRGYVVEADFATAECLYHMIQLTITNVGLGRITP